MIDKILGLLKILVVVLPFILLALLSNKANLKKKDRSRQLYFPLVAVVYCILTGLFLTKINNLLGKLIKKIPEWIESFGEWIGSLFNGGMSEVSNAIVDFAEKLADFVKSLNLPLWCAIIANIAIILAFVILKPIIVRVIKGICKDGKKHYEIPAKILYYRDERKNCWYLKPEFSQGVTLMKTLYIASIVMGVIGIWVTAFLYQHNIIASMYYPVFSVIMVGEVYFLMNGELFPEESSTLEGEDDNSSIVSNYSLMRNVLRRSFGDKLMAENTTVNNGLLFFKTNDELIGGLEEDERAEVEAYGRFMRYKASCGLDVDQNYLMSGLDLLMGKSILFNNPFYYDLVPYIFYPMNRTILRRKKVLIVLGRHAMENDVEEWCRKGLSSVTHIPTLWNIGVLGGEEKNLDVGIVTRSCVHDLKMHEANDDFFAEVELIMLIEPSRLVATAQIGLNSIVKHCRRDGKKLVFCSTDKNCDGIVDALSHILMTSLEEVSATNRHSGSSSYMCWEVDDEHLQHRMLPNLSRYLGIGTELSFSALKNQVSKTSWFGGDAFPVLDMHWIVKQYYYDLLHYASLPTLQSMVDDVFKTSCNMWNAGVEDRNYITVEDESFNMFEVKREFSTRARKQGFVNVISTDYLLKDYMAANDGIFNSDSKAIPYIVADYARTERNVIYRLCLRLSLYQVMEAEIIKELNLIGIKADDVISALWYAISKCSRRVGDGEVSIHRKEELTIRKNNTDYTFDSSIIEVKRKYSFKTGKMESMYSISDRMFIDVFLGDLCSAEYLAEDENGESQYLGSELRGHVFQKYLPGQFFTFGGKYYEMQSLTTDGKVLVRRAADHIHGRPQYRQVRNYYISAAVDSPAMGDSREIGGIKVTKQYADIRVETPAYWRMRRYNDFETGKKVSINGIPNREYHNKQMLRIDFAEAAGITSAVLDTIALLMNEVFRTLYAENQDLIVAVTPKEAQAPLTYSLCGEADCQLSDTSIYIIEDSQLDVGFLVSVERNLNRIFSIICDYLKWHEESLELSLNPPEEPQKPDYSVPEGERIPEKELAEKKGIRKAVDSVKGFFKKLFKRKPKKEKEPKEKKKKDKPEKEKKVKEKKVKEKKVKEKKVKDKKKKGKNIEVDTQEPAVTETAPADETAVADNQPESEVTAPETQQAQETPAEETQSETPEVADESQLPEEAQVTDEVEAESDTPAETTPAPEEAPEDTTEIEAPAQSQDATEEEHPILFSKAPMRFYNVEVSSDADASTPSDEAEPAAQDVPETVAEPAVDNNGGATMEFEPDKAKVVDRFEYKRKPYHERYYLMYGAQEVPQNLDIKGTIDLLTHLGYDNSSLEQARKGKNEAEIIEKNFAPDRAGSHYCDFCGVELMGMEYEVLADGRERCISCSRTAVKSEKEFVKLYNDVINNMKVFYGVVINVPVQIKMVNAKKLHRKLGKAFVPTGNADGRVLGVAIKDKDGYTILIENGSPRMSSVMTMVHELTHIWQYLNWNAAHIKSLYGPDLNLEIYEGMAKWSEIQYAYLINESATAKREEIISRARDDEYGRGFNKYISCYPLSEGTALKGATPFDDVNKPL